MKSVNLADAKSHLSALVTLAETGEPVEIKRRGKTVARITGVAQPRRPIDLAVLRALTDRMPMQSEDAGTFVRAMRDGDRY